MEVFGGNGYVEDGPMGRLFREMPVISIWEGSGNVMGLDMLRAIGREPEALAALADHLGERLGGDPRLRPHLAGLKAVLGQPPELVEAGARRLAQQLVLLLQAALLREHAPAVVADAFVTSRFEPQWGRVFGTLPDPAAFEALIDRAWPR